MNGKARSVLMVTALFLISFAGSLLAMRDFRAGGARPYFYQSNFEPAVMMACGRGFGLTQPQPVTLADFLQERRDSFDCAGAAGAALVPLTAAAHASWYYLYGATAAVWKITGVSWLAVDYLVALLAGVATVMVFGLFRLVSSPGIAAGFALLLFMSPANLTQLLSVRDYSKAPFVLASLLILAFLVLRPRTRAATVAMAAAYGAVVGLGYGFRGDLAIMVPFGAFIVLVFLPGPWREHTWRNVLASISLVTAFGIVAYPVLRGLDKGGCQFHVALLGLTTPLTDELALTSPLYRFGDSLTDTFSILKTGDYATRVLGGPVPEYCDAEYDLASGQLYMAMAATFPADFVVRAYGSVLSVLRWGLEIPAMAQPAPPFASTPAPLLYRALNKVTAVVAPIGPLVTIAAIGVTFASSFRLGLTLTVFVLFLGGYPAIQFEGRHWFHLRFIPWWAGVLVVTQIMARRGRAWEWRPVMVGSAAAAGVVVVLATTLTIVRAMQTQSAAALFAQYEASAVEVLPITSPGAALVDVGWEPRLSGRSFDQRASDLIVVTIAAPACGGTGPLRIRVRYQAGSPSLDLATEIIVRRPAAGESPARIFVPVFSSVSSEQVNQRFSGFEVSGGPATCIASVARVTDTAASPLWLQAALPADWRGQPLYQSLRLPRPLRQLLSGESQ